MAKWLTKMEIPVEAETRSEAWEKAREIAEQLQGYVWSIPQQPEQD